MLYLKQVVDLITKDSTLQYTIVSLRVLKLLSLCYQPMYPFKELEEL